MKILMFGRGIITTQYGWAFEKAGHAVDFYVRPGRAAMYGPFVHLKMLDARKKLKGNLIEEKWHVHLIEDIPEDHTYDLIIVSVQHYQFADAATFLAPKVGNATVLIFNNFWKDPLIEASGFPQEQLAWGFPQAGGGFTTDGVLNGALFPDLQFGTFGTEPTKRELNVRELFAKTGFKNKETKDFRGWLWIHFAVDAGFFAEVLDKGSVNAVFSSAKNLKNAILNIREILKLVEARGIDLNDNIAEIKFYMRPLWLSSLIIKALMKISPPFSKMVYSHDNHEEAISYGRSVLTLAKHIDFKLPRLASIVKSEEAEAEEIGADCEHGTKIRANMEFRAGGGGLS